MPALLIYLLKVNIALVLFCIGYYTILRQLTFYTLNRVYLIVAILFSSIYPCINLWSLFGHQEIAQPIQRIVIILNSQQAELIQPDTQAAYLNWLIIIYWLGMGIMSLRLLIHLFSLVRLHRNSKLTRMEQQPIRIITESTNPFSFWQSIYLNPRQHKQEELPAIIAHEQVHIKQWHTLDILLSELSIVFYWFNPGVWLIKKAVSENLEFITDRRVLQQGTDAKSYQYSLLYTSLNTSPNAIGNHFNISTIKKRIIMMNAKRSSTFSLTRYGFILPAIVLLSAAFGTSKAALLEGAKAKVNLLTQFTSTESAKGIKTNPPTALTEHTKKAQTDTTKVSVRVIKFNDNTDSVLYIVNGKPASNLVLTKIKPANIQRMDVIKPPQSVELFGKSGSKGVISLITKDGVNLPSALQLQRKLKTLPNSNTSKAIEVVTLKFPDTTSQVTHSKNSSGTFVVTGNADTTKQLRIQLREPNKGPKPLIVIDGVIKEHAEIESLNPDDIKSINVLKDASATTPYGEKGKNGVIEITTKNGKKDN
ncbi:TonB-dependent receptor plug domain-containing protein [Mucilaginibacter sp. Bleaf8]|uniref:M56 family metallopeptidase n=1 Tax=Mucilaginibacter sp. Bleaf8 TaxID=2834430 RepID=UPI001BCAE4AA|nr:M56 family metallopeptidase [Mucilaginibacter sp. Bleaf8]MBS7563403.1 TonB-dependent receptor plug domain-containing protein [Mucilaginibacter sp. Bleaf8]